jgi:hypothetical protein
LESNPGLLKKFKNTVSERRSEKREEERKK